MPLDYLRADLPARHGFFTRQGGVSEGPYASLNCSVSGRDDPAHVAENRARVARAMGHEPAALLGLSQVHGIAVAFVDEPWEVVRAPTADAMVTRRADVALGIVTADCAPVLLADSEAGVVGAAHAGWRGAVAGVLDVTLAAMRTLGARRVVAAVGPCIAQESYQVAADLRDAVLAAEMDDGRFLAADGPGHWRFDLRGYVAARLERAGAAVVHAPADTAADSARFFSHRRRTLSDGGPIGHQISVIALGAPLP